MEEQIIDSFEKALLEIISTTQGLLREIHGYFRIDGHLIKPVKAFELTVEDDLPNMLPDQVEHIMGDLPSGYNIHSMKFIYNHKTFSIFVALYRESDEVDRKGESNDNMDEKVKA